MCIFRFSKKHHLVCFLSLLNYGDIGSVLINHLQIVIPLSYPCYYTNLCPHKPHKPAHTHTHTHTHRTVTPGHWFTECRALFFSDQSLRVHSDRRLMPERERERKWHRQRETQWEREREIWKEKTDEMKYVKSSRRLQKIELAYSPEQSVCSLLWEEAVDRFLYSLSAVPDGSGGKAKLPPHNTLYSHVQTLSGFDNSQPSVSNAISQVCITLPIRHSLAEVKNLFIVLEQREECDFMLKEYSTLFSNLMSVDRSCCMLSVTEDSICHSFLRLWKISKYTIKYT